MTADLACLCIPNQANPRVLLVLDPTCPVHDPTSLHETTALTEGRLLWPDRAITWTARLFLALYMTATFTADPITWGHVIGFLVAVPAAFLALPTPKEHP